MGVTVTGDWVSEYGHSIHYEEVGLNPVIWKWVGSFQ